MKIVAKIHTDFKTKFGVPRQSGLVKELKGRIVFEPEYRNPEALRGLEGFSHIWLLWDFSEAHRDGESWSPTVRPPRLGGNQRMGVWATRSPFRPNNIGLSSVRISKIDLHTPEGPVIEVEGADLMDGTPIYDVKPYLPYVDSHLEARGGFTDNHEWQRLQVDISDEDAARFGAEDLKVLKELLSLDPRPHYHQDGSREYGMPFKGFDIRFKVSNGVLSVISIEH